MATFYGGCSDFVAGGSSHITSTISKISDKSRVKHVMVSSSENGGNAQPMPEKDALNLQSKMEKMGKKLYIF